MNIVTAVRKIRACEGEAAAQLVLEYAIAEAVAAEREACKGACRTVAADWAKHGTLPIFESAAMACCEAIDERHNVKVSGGAPTQEESAAYNLSAQP